MVVVIGIAPVKVVTVVVIVIVSSDSGSSSSSSSSRHFPKYKRIFHDPNGFNAPHPLIRLISIDHIVQTYRLKRIAVRLSFVTYISVVFCFPSSLKEKRIEERRKKRLKGRLAHSDSTLTRRVVQGGSSRYRSKSDSIKSAMRSGK